MKKGFFIIERWFTNHHVFQSSPARRLFAFWLIEQAQFADTILIHKSTSKRIHLKRGQIVTSYRKLAKELGCAFNTARNIVADTSAAHLIESHTESGLLIITVCNYSEIQKIKTSTESPTESGIESPPANCNDSESHLESPTESPTEPPAESPIESPSVVVSNCKETENNNLLNATESPTEPPTEPPAESPIESPAESPNGTIITELTELTELNTPLTPQGAESDDLIFSRVLSAYPNSKHGTDSDVKKAKAWFKRYLKDNEKQLMHRRVSFWAQSQKWRDGGAPELVAFFGKNGLYREKSFPEREADAHQENERRVEMVKQKILAAKNIFGSNQDPDVAHQYIDEAKAYFEQIAHRLPSDLQNVYTADTRIILSLYIADHPEKFTNQPN